MSSERIDRLEERLAWLERHVTEQDKEMLAQHEELARLRREFELMRARLTESDSSPEVGSSPEDDRPPHY
jgi:SlyX protein